MTGVPKGIRNNNPGNIERNDIAWAGMASFQSDPRFVIFISPVWGLRAMVRVLQNYQHVGITTLAGAIARWAPINENDTAAYTADVCAKCGIPPLISIDFDDDMPSILKAIVFHENGEQPYDDATIAQAITLAGTSA